MRRPLFNYSPQRRRDAEKVFFSFVADTPTHENHSAASRQKQLGYRILLGKPKEPMILAEGRLFFAFRPPPAMRARRSGRGLNGKQKEKNISAISASLR